MKRNEHWTLPMQPEPTASRKDYLILLGLAGFTVAVMAVCCGFGIYLGKVLFT